MYGAHPPNTARDPSAPSMSPFTTTPVVMTSLPFSSMYDPAARSPCAAPGQRQQQ